MVGEPLALCWFCKHFDTEHKEKRFGFRCTAFPEGIPEEIGGGDLGYWFDHRAPHPDDPGIQFELEDVEQLRQRFPFRRGAENVVEYRLNYVYDYLDLCNTDRAELSDDE